MTAAEEELFTTTPTTDRRIPLTEEESVALVRHHGRLSASFGPSGVWLNWRAGQPMPPQVRAVGMMRGVLNRGLAGEGI
jgi:hypothetical protein